MADRLTVEEFFDVMRVQQIYPLLDTKPVREIVERNVRALCPGYPIKNRWPVLDLESAYEGYLNGQPELVRWHKNGYSGTVNIKGFDNTYEIDEWFNDFRIQWSLVDTPSVQRKMIGLLPTGSKWSSPALYKAHKEATMFTIGGLLHRLFE